MLCLPAFVFTKIRSNSESEALLAEKNITAVCRVNGYDGVIFGELNNPSVFGVNTAFAVHSANPVVAVAKAIKNCFADSCHYCHIKNNID